MSHVIGIDVGSQSLKGVLVEPGGRVAAEATAAYAPVFPRPGYAEQDPHDWVAALRSVLGMLLSTSSLRADAIGAIGIAAQVDGIVPVGSDMEPLRPAIIWMDRRATRECEQIAERVPPETVFGTSGLNLDAAHVAPKAIWLRTHERDVFRAASWLPSPASYLIELLSGERVIDRTNASSTMLYDVSAHKWSDTLLGAAGLDHRAFGRLVRSTDPVGSVGAAGASLFGLATGTVVVGGSGDDHAACLGAGLVRPGMMCDVLGTAEPISATSVRPVFDAEALVEVHEHPDSVLWLLQNPGFVSGGSISWYSDLTRCETVREFLRLAEGAAPGAGGAIFLPCLGGATAPRFDDRARGAFLGLTLSHTRGDLARALLEGCGFAFRDVTDRLVELGVSDGSPTRVVGGGSQSGLWCQIKADITGRPLTLVKSDHATAVGAAMLAAVAHGDWRSLEDASDQLVSVAHTYLPDATHRAVYEDAYARYLASFDSLQPIRWPQQ
jgi:xylulokinase